MAKFRVEHAMHKNGWTRWISPKHGIGDNNYKAKCCDCGLVHEMQFRAVGSPQRRGQIDVIFRMRREPMKKTKPVKTTAARKKSAKTTAVIKANVRRFAPALKRLAAS